MNPKIRLSKVCGKALRIFAKNAPKKYLQILDKMLKIPIIVSIDENLPEKILGLAKLYKNKSKTKITLLAILINKDVIKYKSKDFYEVISHELAHCIDYVLRGRTGHDKQWRHLHKLMNGTGKAKFSA
jgi:hypothetical protein